MNKERKDEIINEKDEIPNKNDLYYLQWENFSLQTKFLYTPHRICSAFILLFCLLYFWPTTETGKFVMIMCISTFVLSIFLQDGPLIRPHPFFWRIILALVIFLILNIVFLCTVEREEIIKYISKMTPGKAGNITNDRDYSMSCVIYDKNYPKDPFHNVKPVIFDVFVPAHFFGWIFQAIILRNTTLCWIVSVLFEVCERMLKHWFPNFNECWWDSIILDIFICNGLGIYIGMKLVNYLALRTWEKRLFQDVNRNEKLKRFLKQFTPRSYCRYNWKPLSSPKRYFVYVFIIASHLMLEVNLFGLKMVLKMTPNNPIVVFLLLIHLIVAMPAVLEYYMYAVGDRDSIGAFGSVCLMLIVSELALTLRNEKDYFDKPTPLHVKLIVSLIISLTLLFPLVWFVILKKGEKENNNKLNSDSKND